MASSAAPPTGASLHFDTKTSNIMAQGCTQNNPTFVMNVGKNDGYQSGLRNTNPCHDKMRIEETKGGLLKSSYNWIFRNSTFRQWRNEEQSQMLWIRGDPGKGKTMLLCGIIDQLKESMEETEVLSYFFCQATDKRINSATAILRGLLYMLVSRLPLPPSAVLEHKMADKDIFEGVNAWYALREIFTDVLQHLGSHTVYLIIDALDECVTGLLELLNFLVQKVSVSSRVKWIVSSRNWPIIEEQLANKEHVMVLSLELNADSVSAAVSEFIHHKVGQLAEQKKYDDETRNAVLQHISSNAHDTFLWVALVCQHLERVKRRRVKEELKTFPPGLQLLYKRMMQQISSSCDADLCKQILAFVAIVHRPITLQELVTLVGELKNLENDLESIREIIGECGSLLTLREDIVYFVHQSAKEFLSTEESYARLSSGREEVHRAIFSRSLQAMSTALHRDMYGLCELDCLFDQIKRPAPDPLAAIRYSCIYWVDHLCELSSDPQSFQSDGLVHRFLATKYIYWLEALSLFQSMSEGVASMRKLVDLVQKTADAPSLSELVQDAYRFIMYNKVAIETAPLQAYVSALLFSPAQSKIRNLFQNEAPGWIRITPISDDWSACLQTLEDHSSAASSVAFSPDSQKMASAWSDRTVKIWDMRSGRCSKTLEGHGGSVYSVAFAPNSQSLASASYDHTVRIWDMSSGNSRTLNEHSGSVYSVAFSPDSRKLASASYDCTVKIWDVSSGKCLQTLDGHSGSVISVDFSPDSQKLASASSDCTVKIWQVRSGKCSKTLNSHSDSVSSVAFSPDSQKLASASYDSTVKIWDMNSNKCLQTFEGHNGWVRSVAFSADSQQLASASDRMIKIWDTSDGNYVQTLEGHIGDVTSVAFSPNSQQLASTSYDGTVKIWDVSSVKRSQTRNNHSRSVSSVAFSPSLQQLASASYDHTVKIWDVDSGKCLQTLNGHSRPVSSVAFSPSLQQLASASYDHTVKIWDVDSGKCLQILSSHSGSISSVAFSPNSKRLSVALIDGTIEIWDVSGKYLQTLGGHSGSVSSVTFSPNSQQLASASYDRTVKVWEISSGKCSYTLDIGKALSNLSFDATGSTLNTDVGPIFINSSDTLSVSIKAIGTTTDEQVRFQGTGLSITGIWITYDSRNIVWIPSEYRPSTFAAAGRWIGVGVGSGRVWICCVQCEES